MHRTIGFISKRLTQIRAGEGPKVFLTFLYFFLVITAYYIIKPVSRSLVLGELGSRLVPYVDLISAVLMGPMVALFARLVDRVDKQRLVSGTFWVVAANLVVFWKLLQWPDKWVPAAFYVWVSVFSVLVVTLFWLVANDLYHPREAKRLFGFIGSGGILGGVVGSSIAAVGANLFGTEQLLLWSAAILIGCWLVVRQLWRRHAPASLIAEHAAPTRPQPETAKAGGGLRTLLGSRYLIFLIGLVGISKIVSTLIYYQFNPFIEQMFPDQDAKTAFTGLFFGWMNAASFIEQFFFTSWILRHLGLTRALLVLPVGLVGGSLGMLLAPIFWMAAATELYDGSMNYSLQQTTKEVLYLPIDRSIRYKVKPFIDMVVFRFGKGIAAIIGIVCLDLLRLEARVLSYLIIPLIIAWMALAVQLRRDYVARIRSILQARAVSRRTHDLEGLTAQQRNGALVNPEHLDAWLESLTPSAAIQQKLTFAGQLFTANGALVEGGNRLLEALARYEQRPTASGRLDPSPSLDPLKECQQDRHEPMVKRRAAVKQLVQQAGQEAVDCLLGMLMVEDDEDMRQELIRGLTKLRLRHPHGLEFPKRLIRRQIAKEVQTYQRIARVAAAYRNTASAVLADGDAMVGLLRVLMEETTQQIFRLLSLLYRPEDIYLIYNQLQEPDAHVRADAIELLDNLIDPPLRRLILPTLDEDQFLQRAEGQVDPEPEDVDRLLREGIWDHNRWLSIVSLSLIGRLRLEPLLSELDRAAQSADPLLSQSAQVARRLTAPSHSGPS